MSTPTIESPNVDNLQVGKGIVSFMKTGEATYRDMGNVTEMVITPDMTTLDHFTSRLGTKAKDLSIVLEKKATVKITMEEITGENVALMVLGTVDEAAIGGPEVEIFAQNVVTGALRFVGTNDIGPKVTVDLWHVSILPSGDFGLITDEWNNMELTADVLPAPDGTNVGKFGLIKFTNVTPAAS